MSRFYAEIQGNRGAASRMGSKDSGIYGHIRGWGHGARVDCFSDPEDNDVTEVKVTGGSGYRQDSRTLVEVREDSKGRRVVRVFHPKTGKCVGTHNMDKRRTTR